MNTLLITNQENNINTTINQENNINATTNQKNITNTVTASVSAQVKTPD